MSLQARLLNLWLRRVEKPILTRAEDPAVLRKRLDMYARFFFHPPRGTQMQWQVLEAAQRRVDILDIVPRAITAQTVVLYIHGGAFVFGSPKTHSAMVAQLCKRLGARAVLPRYRLAPENPFPAAFDDVRTAWDGLIASGVDPKHIIVGGDSAGGALALTLLGALIHDGADLPAGVFCLSPLTDLTYSGESFRANADIEAVLPAARAGDMVEMYLAGHPVDDPRANPLSAEFTGAPRMWITAGDTEILLDDSRRIVARLKEVGVDTTYTEERDLPHVWPLFHNTLPEGGRTLDALSKWIKQRQPAPNES